MLYLLVGALNGAQREIVMRGRLFCSPAMGRRLCASVLDLYSRGRELTLPANALCKDAIRKITEIGGHARNRTGVYGFAVRCVTTPPRGQPNGITSAKRACVQPLLEQ